MTFRAADGAEKELPTLDVYRAYPANQLGTWQRAGVYASRVWEFLSGDPRESNTEGGIFPAIFGTVMMVMLMSVLAVPFGVHRRALPARVREAGRCSSASCASP